MSVTAKQHIEKYHKWQHIKQQNIEKLTAKWVGRNCCFNFSMRHFFVYFCSALVSLTFCYCGRGDCVFFLCVVHRWSRRVSFISRSIRTNYQWRCEYCWSHVMRKPVYAMCEQQRHRSAWSLISVFVVRCLDSISTCYSQNFKTLGQASLISWAGRFESFLVANPDNPHIRHILSWRLGHENIFMAILPHPLIQEEQLSVTGERMCTKYW